MQRVRRIRQPQVTTRVSSLGGSVKRADISRQLDQENVFATVTGDTALIPPFDPSFLASCVERSNMLKQCIAAIVVNVTSGGFQPVQTRDDMEMELGEKEELVSFIESVNSDESLATMLAKVADDYETYGYSFIEAIRDRKGRMSVWRHAPAHSVRLLPKDEDNPQPVTYDIARGPRVVNVTEYRSFRRYVQIVGGRTRYFKEFGDKRKLHMDTGAFDTAPRTCEATELIHIRQHSPDPYGVPRWINQLPSILGSRESEECNLRYFEDNTVPPMILSVSGGRLTKQSYGELKSLLNDQGVGKERQHKIMLIEAVPEREGLDDKGSVSVRIDKLTDSRQSDGLFKEYDEGNQAKVRSSFRLPPVAVGLSQDVTFACYDEQTQTLTDHGWVGIDEWRDGMKIACVAPGTGGIEFHEPEAGLQSYDVEGVSMYRILTEQQDMCVTPNHRMLFASGKEAEWTVQPIEQMVDRHRVYLRTSGDYQDGTGLSEFLVPESPYGGGVAARDAAVGSVATDTVLEWIGCYIADGCIRQNGNAVSIGAKKPRKVLHFTELHDTLEDAGFRVRRSHETAGTYFTVSHKGFVTWLAANAGTSSATKRIPDFVWGLPAAQLRVLFDALMSCDGTWDAREGRTSGSYSTVSPQLADDMQRLSVLLGYRASVREDRPGTYGHLPLFRVMLSRKGTCQVYPDRHITREQYTGRVYCFTVPTGVFVTRRNGKVAMQGNTANVSAAIAESQVYRPLRDMFDEVLNKRLVNGEQGMALRTCKLVSRVPAITNGETLIKSLTALNVMGALTPRMANDAANSILQIELPQYPAKGEQGYEDWTDRPSMFITRGVKSQDGQDGKDATSKQVEKDGNPAMTAPEHGNE